MKDFLKSLGFKVLTVVALFLVGVMIYAASTGGAATIPATIVSAVVTPLQTIASSLSDGVNSFIGIFTDSGSENNCIYTIHGCNITTNVFTYTVDENVIGQANMFFFIVFLKITHIT